MSASDSRYTNPETKRKLDAARQARQTQEFAEQVEEATSNAAAKADLAGEDQPGHELPDLRETQTVEFRGEPMEFHELGGAVIDTFGELGSVQEGDGDPDVDESVDMADYVYELLAEKSVHEAATESWWRQYDLYRDDDVDGVFDVVDRLLGESMGDVDDVDPEVADRVEEFRGE